MQQSESNLRHEILPQFDFVADIVLDILYPDLIPRPPQSHLPHHICVNHINSALISPRTFKVMADSATKRRFVIGPAIPSPELLSAAAKLSSSASNLRESEDDMFIGPQPSSITIESESANDAEKFEEVTRIMDVDLTKGTPYDVIGVNHKMSDNNVKKKYWKLSLMVHPDKRSHPHAPQAFVKLNKAFKDLQDLDKRRVVDEGIRVKERFEVEMKAMREAARWRRLQGITMVGDDELLAEETNKMMPRRDEWMTKLPPERRPGVVSMRSTKAFSSSGREGRGNTSVWTDTPDEKTKKAKTDYLEAYNRSGDIASNEEKKRSNSDNDLVDKYSRAKRSKSLLEKHQDELKSNRKKGKSKKGQKNEEWVGQHPWKPWDHENDLNAGRRKVNLDADTMGKGLSSRFSSGAVQRSFL